MNQSFASAKRRVNKTKAKQVISIKMAKDLFVMPDRQDDARYGA
jgi:hypothetical protein